MLSRGYVVHWSRSPDRGPPSSPPLPSGSSPRWCRSMFSPVRCETDERLYRQARFFTRGVALSGHHQAQELTCLLALHLFFRRKPCCVIESSAVCVYCITDVVVACVYGPLKVLTWQCVSSVFVILAVVCLATKSGWNLLESQTEAKCGGEGLVSKLSWSRGFCCLKQARVRIASLH